MGSVIRMYGTGDGGTDNAIASIDMPMNTTILACQWDVGGDNDADDEYYVAQLSFTSTYAVSNDQRAVISEVRTKLALTTSGVWVNHINLYVALPEIKVFGGERLYLHVDATAGLLTTVSCFVHLANDMDLAAMRRR